MAIPDPMAIKTTTPPVLNIADLTTGVVNGSGVFDVLMRSVNAHLDLQFKMGRVTGTEYSGVYIDALKQVLMLSSEVMFQKEKQAYELSLLEKQNAAADEEIKAAKIAQEKTRKEIALIDREITRIDVQIDTLAYEHKNKLPIEVENLKRQGNLLEDEHEIKAFQLGSTMPAEVNNMIKQGTILTTENLVKTYQLNNIMPLEVEEITKRIDIQERGTSIQERESIKRIESIDSELLTAIKQRDSIIKQTEIESYKLESMLPVETSNMLKQGTILSTENLIKNYQLDNVMPLEVEEIVKRINVQERTTVLQENESAKRIESINSELLTATIQRDSLNKQIEIEDYKLDNLLPVEVGNLTKQGEMLLAETGIKAYQLSDVLPVEVGNLQKNGQILESEYSTKQYNLTTTLPLQSVLLDKQSGVLDQELLNLPAQREGIEADTANKVKQFDVLTSQINNQDSQTALYEQKLLSERATIDASLIGLDSPMHHQKELLKAQTVGFGNEAKQKAVKLLLDTWVVRFNEEAATAGTVSENGISRANVKNSVWDMLDSVGIQAQDDPTTP